MNLPKIVARDVWLVARRRLLVEEKDFTRARDALNAERRRLPMVRIDKVYVCDGPSSTTSATSRTFTPATPRSSWCPAHQLPRPHRARPPGALGGAAWT
jgi:hypothetical protein